MSKLLAITATEIFEYYYLNTAFNNQHQPSFIGHIYKPLDALIREIYGISRQGIHCISIILLASTTFLPHAKSKKKANPFKNRIVISLSLYSWFALALTSFLVDSWRFEHIGLLVKLILAGKTLILGIAISLFVLTAIINSQYKYKSVSQSPYIYLSNAVLCATITILLDRFFELSLCHYATKYSSWFTLEALISHWESTRYLDQSFITKWIVLIFWFFAFLSMAQTNYLHRRQEKLKFQLLNTEKNQKLSQLAYLNSQLDTHFLFNALTGIRYLVTHTPGTARSSLDAFSDLLRFAIESSKETKTRLNNELSFTRDYLKLRQLERDKPLNYSIQCFAKENSPIPPMVIQMLAENAIKHGSFPPSESKQLKITVHQKNSMLIIKSINSGLISTSTTKMDDCIEQNKGCGIALSNIQKRLTILYANRYKMSLKEKMGHVIAVIEIPYEVTTCAP